MTKALAAFVALLAGCGTVGIEKGNRRGDFWDQFEESTEYKWSYSVPMKTAKEKLGLWGQ